MRQRGFSLAEVSIATAIAAGLTTLIATAALYTDSTAKNKRMMDKAHEIAMAVDAYMNAARGIDFPGRNSTSESILWSSDLLGPFISRYLPSGTTTYRRPNNGQDWIPGYLTLVLNGGNYYPNTYDTAPPISYHGHQGIRYVRNAIQGTGAMAPSFKVYKSTTETVTFKYWSVYVIDEKGYPMGVWGR